MTTVPNKEYSEHTPFFESEYTIPLQMAMRRLLELVPERPAFVLEGMGGFGLDTESVQMRWPGIKHRVYERDASTYEKLDAKCVDLYAATDGRAKISAIHSDYTGTDEVPENTLLILSMNTYTLLPAKVEAARPFFRPNARWVAYVDMCGLRLHLVYKAYGFTERPTHQQYYERAAAVHGRRLVGWVRGFRAFNFVLLGERA